MKSQRRQEYLLLALIVFLSFVTALAVFFLDATKDLRQRAAETVSMVCNRSCTENRDCLSNMVCWPYGRPSDQKGYCRLDSNPENVNCQERQGVGFIIQVYNDLNADGIRNNNEQGQGWEYNKTDGYYEKTHFHIMFAPSRIWSGYPADSRRDVVSE
jgi:hypothetical protein